MHLIFDKVLEREEELDDLVRILGDLLKPGDWIRLEGDMGLGKTTLVRRFLKAQGIEEPVVSPTYPLCVEYEVKGQAYQHIDGFRLGASSEDPWDPGEWKDDIVFVEWPEKTHLPQKKFKYLVVFESLEEGAKRRIRLFSL